MRNFVLTSESVTAGHPDKLADQVSDAIVDACLVMQPPTGCVAECAISPGVVFLSVRHGRALGFDPVALSRRVLVARAGQGSRPPTVMLDTVEAQELPGPDGVPRAQQMTTAFGYACDHTEEMMPWPIWAAHRISAALGEASGREPFGWLSPDAQVQLAVRFEDRRPVAISGIALTLCAEKQAPAGEVLEEMIAARIIRPALDGAGLAPTAETRLVIRCSPAPGGPSAHSGLTGRKTADDGYGGFVRQSSSALSGKDPSRIDRVAAYAARQAAVSVLASGLARECEVQLSYVPGDEAPASVELDSFESGVMPDRKISDTLARAIDFRFGAVVERLQLWDLPRARGGCFYQSLACYGQFGRADLDLPWDRPLPMA